MCHQRGVIVVCSGVNGRRSLQWNRLLLRNFPVKKKKISVVFFLCVRSEDFGVHFLCEISDVFRLKCDLAFSWLLDA